MVSFRFLAAVLVAASADELADSENCFANATHSEDCVAKGSPLMRKAVSKSINSHRGMRRNIQIEGLPIDDGGTRGLWESFWDSSVASLTMVDPIRPDDKMLNDSLNDGTIDRHYKSWYMPGGPASCEQKFYHEVGVTIAHRKAWQTLIDRAQGDGDRYGFIFEGFRTLDACELALFNASRTVVYMIVAVGFGIICVLLIRLSAAAGGGGGYEIEDVEYLDLQGFQQVDTVYEYNQVDMEQSDGPPMGVSMSKGEKRVPILNHACWRNIGDQVFSPMAHVILMTDGSPTYAEVKFPGVVQHFSVNHQEKIFARSVEVIGDVKTKEPRDGMASTLTIDRVWRSIKNDLPSGGVSCQTTAGRDNMALRIRGGQWKCIHSTNDRWPLFGQAVREWLKGVSPASEGTLVQTETASPPAAVAQPKNKRGRGRGGGRSKTRSGGDPSLPLPDDLFMERQEGAETCAAHAVNHVLQRRAYSPADFQALQQAVADELLEGADLHGRASAEGDWSIEVIGRALRAQGCNMRMICVSNVADCMRHLGECRGFVLGSGTHWTCLLLKEQQIIHLDSLGRPDMPVGIRPPHLRWLSGKAVFKVVDGDAEDEIMDAAQRQRVSERFAIDWGKANTAAPSTEIITVEGANAFYVDV